MDINNDNRDGNIPDAVISHRVPGASDKTNIPETKIWDAIKNGELAAKKCGRTTLIEDRELRRWIRGLPDRVVNRRAAAV